ncbi:coiled-coil domain-containing protein 50 isoform X2 [Equus quagga]|nr:coiled-coil domain-containing protein 50 isoform X2 [Equus quagga]
MLTAPLTLMIPFWTTPVAFLLRPSGHKAPTERRDPPLGGRQGWGRGHSGASASGASPGTKEPAGRRPREPISARQPLATAVPDLQLPSPSISPPPPHPGPPAHLSVSSLPPYWPARVHFRAPAIWYRSGPGVREQVAAAGQLGRRLGRRRPSPAAFVASPCPAARPPRARALPLGLCAASGAAAAVAARGAALGAGGGRAAGRLGAAGPRANMAEVGIDQSKLPGVKEVCRDFAVLEDHTLAHSLQEQEIEHHLASNVQRNRLVQHDLQVAKQLQEEDLKAQAQLQKRYKDLEQQDCEIAQEIQEKLAIEAERRRIQEKKDEDIARLLQEKELQEEKKRKKHFPESSGANAYGDSYYYEDGGMKPRGMKEAVSTPSRVTHRNQEWYDAEIARKLQEEEILATQVDRRAAQVAQDEEIARLLMAEEKKAYKKAKEREKSSLDKRKHDPDWKTKPAKSAHSKSKESDEPHRSKNDRPARPPPPTMTDPEDLGCSHFTNQHNSTRHFSKSECSHKGFHYKQ